MIKSNPKVTKYISNLPEKQKKIVEKLRKIILKNFPKIKEELKWSLPYYSPLAYIQAHKNHVNLGLLFGALLQNPPKIVEGTGKNYRHIKIKKSLLFTAD